MPEDTPVFPFRPDMFWLVAILQKFTHDAWLYRRTMLTEPRLREPDRKEFLDRMRGWLLFAKRANLIYDFDLVFDESVWPPDSETAYDNVVILRIRSRLSSEVHYFKIDLSKPLFSCFMMAGLNTDWPVNIFKASFSLTHKDSTGIPPALLGEIGEL